MDIKDIPVRIFGPGSQPESDDGQTLSYIDMPSTMATYQPPNVPGPEAVTGLGAARDAMSWLRDTLETCDTTTPPMLADLGALDAENRELVNQILGEGEVSVRFDGAAKARTQESVLAGVWRTLYFNDDNQVCGDILEVATVPHTARAADGDGQTVPSLPDADEDANMSNALAILSELRSHCARYDETGEPHSINLTLLPFSEAELEFLDTHLGRGPVDVLSRAYGKCQVISTATANLWWVRYYNSMDTLILNMLEVVDVPNVVAAAVEDINDSAERLKEILEPYWPGNA